MKRLFWLYLISTAVLTITFCAIPSAVLANDDDEEQNDNASMTVEKGWQSDFHLADRTLATEGENRYFILKPGFQLVLADENEELTITVFDEIIKIGNFDTRVVEEREEEDGQLKEISRNFFAIDAITGDVFYFGEEVDIYKNGEIANHEGAWQAYQNNAMPGLMMPGTPVNEMKYYQEIAPGKAMDRAEIISQSERFKTPAGDFENCLKTKESSGLNPLEREYKHYAPGIGLIQDEGLLLVRSGYIDKD